MAQVIKVTGGRFPVRMRCVDGAVFSNAYGWMSCPAYEIEIPDKAGGFERVVITNQGAVIRKSSQTIRDASGHERVVFHTAWENWKNDGSLPPGALWVSGNYMTKAVRERTTIGSNYVRPVVAAREKAPVGDSLSSAGCVVGGLGVMFGGPLAPAFAAILGLSLAYQASRTKDELVYRDEHELSINPISDKQALALWLRGAVELTGVGAIVAAPVLGALTDIGVMSETTAGATEGLVGGTARLAAIGNGVNAIKTAWDEKRWLTSDELVAVAFAGIAGAQAFRALGGPKPPEGIPPVRVVRTGINVGADTSAEEGGTSGSDGVPDNTEGAPRAEGTGSIPKRPATDGPDNSEPLAVEAAGGKASKGKGGGKP